MQIIFLSFQSFFTFFDNNLHFPFDLSGVDDKFRTCFIEHILLGFSCCYSYNTGQPVNIEFIHFLLTINSQEIEKFTVVHNYLKEFVKSYTFEDSKVSKDMLYNAAFLGLDLNIGATSANGANYGSRLIVLLSDISKKNNTGMDVQAKVNTFKILFKNILSAGCVKFHKIVIVQVLIALQPTEFDEEFCRLINENVFPEFDLTVYNVIGEKYIVDLKQFNTKAVMPGNPDKITQESIDKLTQYVKSLIDTNNDGAPQIDVRKLLFECGINTYYTTLDNIVSQLISLNERMFDRRGFVLIIVTVLFNEMPDSTNHLGLFKLLREHRYMIPKLIHRDYLLNLLSCDSSEKFLQNPPHILDMIGLKLIYFTSEKITDIYQYNIFNDGFQSVLISALNNAPQDFITTLSFDKERLLNVNNVLLMYGGVLLDHIVEILLRDVLLIIGNISPAELKDFFIYNNILINTLRIFVMSLKPEYNKFELVEPFIKFYDSCVEQFLPLDTGKIKMESKVVQFVLADGQQAPRIQQGQYVIITPSIPQSWEEDGYYAYNLANGQRFVVVPLGKNLPNTNYKSYTYLEAIEGIINLLEVKEDTDLYDYYTADQDLLIFTPGVDGKHKIFISSIEFFNGREPLNFDKHIKQLGMQNGQIVVSNMNETNYSELFEGNALFKNNYWRHCVEQVDGRGLAMALGLDPELSRIFAKLFHSKGSSEYKSFSLEAQAQQLMDRLTNNNNETEPPLVINGDGNLELNPAFDHLGRIIICMRGVEDDEDDEGEDASEQKHLFVAVAILLRMTSQYYLGTDYSSPVPLRYYASLLLSKILEVYPNSDHIIEDWTYLMHEWIARAKGFNFMIYNNERIYFDGIPGCTEVLSRGMIQKSELSMHTPPGWCIFPDESDTDDESDTTGSSVDTNDESYTTGSSVDTNDDASSSDDELSGNNNVTSEN